jgi:hypothetical protein
VTLEEGLYYVLWGSSSGTLSLTGYTVNTVDMLNGVDVAAPQHATSFTTALPVSSGAPTTFDPSVGGDATASAGHTIQHRFL